MSQVLKTFDESAPVQVDSPCSRCGITIPWQTIAKRISRGNHEDRCRDCLATQAVKVPSSTGAGNCYPWSGDIDLDTMQPLKRDGSLHLPGERLCGRSDCVNRNHIIDTTSPTLFEMLEAERHDLSYRTGKRRNYAQLVAAVKKEARA